ncbi:MAG: prepilin peptidase [Lachnospiraceae bacterium]|nr:prepilin peptidase [Lachnospiraceae bacterium]
MIAVLKGVLALLRFAVGACVFSFINVVIFRLPRGVSVVLGRSHCPACGRILTARELIPCVSFLVQRGRCAGCKKPISGRYFMGECLGGLAFLCCGAWFGYGEAGLLSLRGLLAFAYLAILMAVAGIDWDTRIIYDRFHIAIMVLGAAALWLFPEHGLVDRLIGAAAVSLPMLVLTLCVEGAFGGGDIKLMAASGFLLGWKAIIAAMFLGLISGGLYCVWMLAKGRLSRKDRFAFGPFLAAGLAASFFFGDAAAQWYLSIL